MGVVKLEKKKQKGLKTISKIMYILAKIGKVLTIVGAVFATIGMIISIMFLNAINIKGNNEFEMKIGNGVIQYKEVDEVPVITMDGQEVKLENNDVSELKTLARGFTKESKQKIMIYLVSAMIFGIADLVLVFCILKYVDKLFYNIYKEDSPFILENVECLRKMVYFMIATVVVSILSNVIAYVIVGRSLNFNFKYNLFTMLFLYAMSYIFEYGYNLQQGTEGRIYGDENE